jgi:hypothetical protein
MISINREQWPMPMINIVKQYKAILERCESIQKLFRNDHRYKILFGNPF